MTAHTPLEFGWGITAEVAAYVGVARELVIDTTLWRFSFTDGATAGGVEATGGALAWQTPTLANSWVAFGSTKQGPRFRRNLFGEVTVQGDVKSGSVSATIFTLPAGYRPAADLDFVCWATGGAVLITVQSDGQVVPTSASATLTSLSGIRFPT